MTTPRRYNLGSGINPPEGYVNVDLREGPGVDIVQDLNEKGWGAKLYPASEIICTDVVEHLDDALAFVGECWDMLVPGGTLRLKICGEHNITLWQDPTHKRPYTMHSFDILDPDTDMGYRYPHYDTRKWKILDRKQDELGNPHIWMTPRKEDAKPAPISTEGKTVEVVLPYRGWCLERAARILEKHSRFDVKITEKLEGACDLVYYVPWHEATTETEQPAVMMFTHLNRIDWPGALTSAKAVDHITVLSEDSKAQLVKLGVPAQKIDVIHFGTASSFKPNKIRIGTSGRPYANGRKRQWIFEELAWRMSLQSLAVFEFLFIGPDWDSVVTSLRHMGVSAQQQVVADNEVAGLVKTMDYYLATGFSEGGPLGVQEALACGVPVISYPTGVAIELADVVTHYKTIGELKAILEGIAAERVARVKAVNGWTWRRFVDEHDALFARMLAAKG